jgi:hypothetical protein
MFKNINLHGDFQNDPIMEVYKNDFYPDHWDITADRKFMEKHFPYKDNLNLIPNNHFAARSIIEPNPDLAAILNPSVTHTYYHEAPEGGGVIRHITTPGPGIEMVVPNYQSLDDIHNHVINRLLRTTTRERLRNLVNTTAFDTIHRLLPDLTHNRRWLSWQERMYNVLNHIFDRYLYDNKSWKSNLSDFYRDYRTEANKVFQNDPVYANYKQLETAVPEFIRKYILEEPSTKMSLINKLHRLRNTYQVPAGREVVVDTPMGQKKYTGGQFVEPEQLANAHERTSGGSEGGNAGDSAEGGPGWDEISQEFKLVDSSDSAALRSAGYRISQFIKLNIHTTKSVTPTCKYAVQLAVANILNSQPGFSKLCEDSGVQIFIKHPKDEERKTQSIAGKDFVKLGEIDFKKNTITYYQYGDEVQNLVKKTANFIVHKLALIVIRQLITSSKISDDDISKVDNDIQSAQTTLKNMINEYSSRNKGKPPKPGADKNIDDLQQNLQELLMQKEQAVQLKTVMGELKTEVQKEGGVNSYIDELIINDADAGISEQVAHIISQANIYGLSMNGTFEKGMEQVAQHYPDSTDKTRNLLMFIAAVTQQEQEQGGLNNVGA